MAQQRRNQGREQMAVARPQAATASMPTEPRTEVSRVMNPCIAASGTQPRSTQAPATQSSTQAATACATRPGTACTPSDADVAKEAYLMYLREGRPNGKDVEHWLKAKTQLERNRRN